MEALATEMADPEALYQQRGVRQLIRKTVAVSVLGSVPSGTSGGGRVPAVISCFASALEGDWTDGAGLGPQLEAAVTSFNLAPT